MRCRGCNVNLNDWELKRKDPRDNEQFLDLCGACYNSIYTEENDLKGDYKYGISSEWSGSFRKH